MGCDIHVVTQKKDDDGHYQKIDGPFEDGSPFSWRNYSVFAFLADVRNYGAITPISEPRELPDDWDSEVYEDTIFGSMDGHSRSWLSVEELTSYDYDQQIEDRRTAKRLTPNLVTGNHTCPPDEGKIMTLREYLGEQYFKDLEILNQIQADRIVFCFDN